MSPPFTTDPDPSHTAQMLFSRSMVAPILASDGTSVASSKHLGNERPDSCDFPRRVPSHDDYLPVPTRIAHQIELMELSRSICPRDGAARHNRSTLPPRRWLG